MGFQQNVQELSPLAGADLSAAQFKVVKLSTAADNTVVLGAANADVLAGVLTNKPKSGQAAAVQYGGVAKAVYGASVTRGDALMSNTSGQLITQTSTNPIFARALESGASGEIHPVEITRQ